MKKDAKVANVCQMSWNVKGTLTSPSSNPQNLPTRVSPLFMDTNYLLICSRFCFSECCLIFFNWILTCVNAKAKYWISCTWRRVGYFPHTDDCFLHRFKEEVKRKQKSKLSWTRHFTRIISQSNFRWMFLGAKTI